MKKIIAVIIAMSVFMVSASPYYQGEKETYKLSKDVKITQRNMDDYFNNGSYQRQSINIIEANMSERTTIKPTISYDSVLGLETLKSQSERALNNGEKVLASINCDMFYIASEPPEMLGIPMNATIIDGILYTSAQNYRESELLPAVTVDKDGKAGLKHISLTCKIKFTDSKGNEDEYTSFMLNRTYGNTSISIFTRKINSDGIIKLCDYEQNQEYGVNADKINFYVISGIDNADNIMAGKLYHGTVEAINRKTLETSIPEGCIAISDYNNMMKSVKKGDTVEFEYTINEFDESGNRDKVNNDIVQCVGAYNWLIKDGNVYTEEKIKEEQFPPLDSLVTTRYARTGIGFKEDGTIIAVTVDCMNDGSSLGMTMEEFADLFKDLGAVNAVNFDGGRSTQMMVLSANKDEMVRMNTSTDGGSRPIATGLLFISQKGAYKGLGENNNMLLIVGASLLIAGAITVGTVIIIKRVHKDKHLVK